MKLKKKKLEKRGTEETNTSWWSKKKKKKGEVSFVDSRSFKTNKRMILLCRELESGSRNEKWYIHNIFTTFSQQILSGKLLVVVIVGLKK